MKSSTAILALSLTVLFAPAAVSHPKHRASVTPSVEMSWCLGALVRLGIFARLGLTLHMSRCTMSGSATAFIIRHRDPELEFHGRVPKINSPKGNTCGSYTLGGGNGVRTAVGR